jgi:hypothetical protein
MLNHPLKNLVHSLHQKIVKCIGKIAHLKSFSSHVQFFKNPISLHALDFENVRTCIIGIKSFMLALSVHDFFRSSLHLIYVFPAQVEFSHHR